MVGKLGLKKCDLRVKLTTFYFCHSKNSYFTTAAISGRFKSFAFNENQNRQSFLCQTDSSPKTIYL